MSELFDKQVNVQKESLKKNYPRVHASFSKLAMKTKADRKNGMQLKMLLMGV